MPGGLARAALATKPGPPYAATAQGCELIDVDGHRLIDLHADFSALVHGNAHPVITQAAVAALERGACFGLPTATEVALAEHLQARQPSLERLRFTNSGSEAVMMAIRVARAWSGKEAVLRFAGCYHGCYDAVAGDRAPGRPASLHSEVITVPVGDAARFFEALVEHGERLAGVLLDLMPNRAGLSPAPREFASLVRRATAQLGIALIVDEVITFRLCYGGMQDDYELTPDLTVLGKVIGGGLPVGALGGRTEIMAVLDPTGRDPVDHGGTFTANPVTMSAGLAALELLRAQEIARINSLGDRLRDGLCELGYETNGRGSLLKIVGEADLPALWWRLYRAGVLIAQDGLLSVSTVMNEAVIDKVLARFAGLA
jgi:glutamate-1-semialdehyde 2,1-aminomutase